MFAFLLRRVLQTVPIILAVALLIFVLFSVIPGTFASSIGDDGRNVDGRAGHRAHAQGARARRSASRALRKLRPPARDLRSRHLVPHPRAGDRSCSPRGCGRRLQLCFAAMVFAIVIGVPLGFVAALRPGSLIDTLSMVGAVSGLSLPKFWLGLMLMYLFALKLGWLPSFGYGDGGLRYIVLPAVALGVAPLALLARTTRAAVLEILNADFVRTARSKGMSERQVVHWHLAAQRAGDRPHHRRPAVRLADGPGGGRREAVRLARPRIAAGRQRQPARHPGRPGLHPADRAVLPLRQHAGRRRSAR